MPVYLFTIHGYRTWMPDHPDGYTRKNEGVFAPDDAMNESYARRSAFDEIRFDVMRQKTVVDACIEFCQTISARLYYGVCVDTHVHPLVGWTDDREWGRIHDRLKSVIALKLARSEGVKDRRWLASGRSGERVETSEHFGHLMTVYLPDHVGYTYFDPKAMEDARAHARGS